MMNIKARAILTILWICFIFQTAFAQEKSKMFSDGLSHFTKEEFKQALKCFEKEYKKNPSIEVKYWIGNTYGQLHEIDLAKTTFLEIIKSEATTGEEIILSYTMMSRCHQALKQKDSTLYYLDQSIKRFPDSASAHFYKGVYFHDLMEYGKAKPYLDKAIELNPTESKFYDYRHFIFFTTLDYASALSDLLQLKKLDPKANIEFNLAYSYSMLKRHQEADSVFQLIYDDTDARFLNNYGMNKFQMGDAKEGKMLIMRSIGIDPKNSYAFRNLGLIAISEGEVSKACDYFEKAKIFGFTNSYGNEINELIKKHCK